MSSKCLRTELADHVLSVVFTRGDEYNTIIPELRTELNEVLDQADDDDDVRVILLRAEGRAFCAGYGLDWCTDDQAVEQTWDSVQDMRKFIGPYVETFLRLWSIPKPTVAAVQGWCVGGGTDMVLNCDFIIAGENASFGYPPARVYGIPTTAMWGHRIGWQQTKRFLFTGDEITARVAEEIGLVLETVPDDMLQQHTTDFARRVARVPLSQLVMLKMLCNQNLENMGLRSTLTLGTLLDGVARHTPEGLRFVDRSQAAGWRQAVRERDDPFGDYGSRSR
jgi:enoyl-CoA hydratase